MWAAAIILRVGKRESARGCGSNALIRATQVDRWSTVSYEFPHEQVAEAFGTQADMGQSLGCCYVPNENSRSDRTPADLQLLHQD